MQIILTQPEIELAIEEFLAKRITIAEGTKVSVEMKATRGAEGFQAFIDLEDDVTPVHAKAISHENSKPASIEEPAAADKEPEAKVETTKTTFRKKTSEETEKAEDTKAEPAKGISEPEYKPEPTTKPKSLFAGMKT